ncbi:MAG: hypothetical protein AAFQ43_09660 [Bacteroidota bacterium]
MPDPAPPPTVSDSTDADPGPPASPDGPPPEATTETTPTASPEADSRRTRALRLAGRLSLELLVVFVGVYAAFLLSQVQESRRDDARRTAIYQALLTDIERTEAQIADHREILRSSWLEPIAEPYARGEQPVIYSLWLPTPPQSGVWDSVLESGVDLLDPALIEQVEAQRADVQFMLDQANTTIQRSNDHITPLLGTTDFYGADGRLRPQFAWYVRFLGYLDGNAERAAASTETLRAELERRVEA